MGFLPHTNSTTSRRPETGLHLPQLAAPHSEIIRCRKNPAAHRVIAFAVTINGIVNPCEKKMGGGAEVPPLRCTICQPATWRPEPRQGRATIARVSRAARFHGRQSCGSCMSVTTHCGIRLRKTGDHAACRITFRRGSPPERHLHQGSDEQIQLQWLTTLAIPPFAGTAFGISRASCRSGR